MTEDDFEIVTEYGRLLGVTGQFNREQFAAMMQGELFRYARRGLTNTLKESSNDEFKQMALMLKLVELKLLSKIDLLSGGVHQKLDTLQATQERMCTLISEAAFGLPAEQKQATTIDPIGGVEEAQLLPNAVWEDKNEC